MVTKSYLEQVQDDILIVLGDQPQSIPELAERLQLPYTTVQQAHKALREDGKITKFDRKDRGARYTLAVENSGKRRTIPLVRWGKRSMTPLEIFRSDNATPMWLKGAGDNIAKTWVTIAMTAQRLQEGMPDGPLSRRLKTQKAELVNARNMLEAILFLINQLLENPKFWDMEYLQGYANDPDWEEYLPILNKLYNDYYGSESKDD